MERIPRFQLAATGATIALSSIALVTFSRRIAASGLENVLPGEAAFYAAVFAAASIVAVQKIADSLVEDRGREIAPPIAAFLLTLLFLAGLSTDPVAILCGVLSTAAVIGMATYAAPSVARDAGRTTTHHGDAAESLGGDAELRLETPPVATHEEESGSPGHHVELVRSVEGSTEQVRGTLRFVANPGETATTLHVPLWPPLAGVPHVQCELEGIDGRATVPHAKPHGFRIEVRLPEPVDEPLDGTVRFRAEYQKRASAA